MPDAQERRTTGGGLLPEASSSVAAEVSKSIHVELSGPRVKSTTGYPRSKALILGGSLALAAGWVQ